MKCLSRWGRRVDAEARSFQRCASSRIYGLPPSPCATRRLGAFIHNAADIRMRGQGDPYNHHTSSKSRGYCAGGSGSRRIGVLRQLRRTSHPSAGLRLLRQRVERSAGGYTALKGHVAACCGNMAARLLRLGLRQAVKAPSILGVMSLRRGETSRRRAHVQARFIAG